MCKDTIVSQTNKRNKQQPTNNQQHCHSPVLYCFHSLWSQGILSFANIHSNMNEMFDSYPFNSQLKYAIAFAHLFVQINPATGVLNILQLNQGITFVLKFYSVLIFPYATSIVHFAVFIDYHHCSENLILLFPHVQLIAINTFSYSVNICIS